MDVLFSYGFYFFFLGAPIAIGAGAREVGRQAAKSWKNFWAANKGLLIPLCL
jgi:hypothetical protein